MIQPGTVTGLATPLLQFILRILAKDRRVLRVRKLLSLHGVTRDADRLADIGRTAIDRRGRGVGRRGAGRGLRADAGQQSGRAHPGGEESEAQRRNRFREAQRSHWAG